MRPMRIALLILLLSLADLSVAREWGLRAGGGDGFNVIETYTRWDADFSEAARWDVTVGHWSGSVNDANFIAIGPVLEWAVPERAYRVSLGVQPTLLSEYEGNGRNLGGPFQFKSHLSVAWPLFDHLLIGLRIQHTSNAGIYEVNEGVSMMSAELGYLF